jgi:hypothetical protein
LSVSSPALAIARGSSDSFGDRNPVFVQKPAGCSDSWYVNGWNRGEPRGEQVGMAVAEFGKGRLLALGDQDLFWNFHFNADRRRLVRNALAWLSD